MAEVEEPQFTSLQDRIAALNQSQGSQHQTFGKRNPPPLPTARPGLAARGQTTNNPPIVTYGSSVTKQVNNQPSSVKTVKGNLLPPPPIDRDQPQPTNTSKTPPLPSRNAPPPLPTRNGQPSPALPPRKASTQLVRRGSNSSTLSYSSTVSGLSLS